MSLPTETGLVSSQPLAEISVQPQIASTASLLGYWARHWLPFTSTFDTWSFVRDRLRHHDIAGLFCTSPAWRQPCWFAPCALHGRWHAFLFRGSAPMDVNLWIDSRKPDEQTVELDLYCFGSRTFSPCMLVVRGCSKERLGTLAVDHKLRCHGRYGFCSFRPGHKHLETKIASRIERRELP